VPTFVARELAPCTSIYQSPARIATPFASNNRETDYFGDNAYRPSVMAHHAWVRTLLRLTHEPSQSVHLEWTALIPLLSVGHIWLRQPRHPQPHQGAYP